MDLSPTDPRLLELEATLHEHGLTTAQGLSCLLWAVAVHSKRGDAAVAALRLTTNPATGLLHFDFDELAEDAGVTPDELLDLYLLGVERYAEHVKAKTAVLQ